MSLLQQINWTPNVRRPYLEFVSPRYKLVVILEPNDYGIPMWRVWCHGANDTNWHRNLALTEYRTEQQVVTYLFGLGFLERMD